MNIQICPYFKHEGKWSIPYLLLMEIWDEMVLYGRDQETFYDGGVKSAEDFICFAQDRSNLFVFAYDIDSKKILAFGFFNGMKDKLMYAHFSFLEKYLPGVGEMIIDYVSGLKDKNNERMFDVLIGITPESYRRVIDIIQGWGFKTIGTIPRICSMHYKQEKEGGVISYFLTGG